MLSGRPPPGDGLPDRPIPQGLDGEPGSGEFRLGGASGHRDAHHLDGAGRGGEEERRREQQGSAASRIHAWS